jgi:hypothetical protein
LRINTAGIAGNDSLVTFYSPPSLLHVIMLRKYKLAMISWKQMNIREGYEKENQMHFHNFKNENETTAKA